MKRFNEQYTMFYYYYLNKNILLLDDVEKYLDDFKNMIANYDYLSVVDMFLEESKLLLEESEDNIFDELSRTDYYTSNSIKLQAGRE